MRFNQEMDTTDDIRRENLGRLREQFDTFAALNRRLGRNVRDATFNQIWNRSKHSKSGNPRAMGKQLARDIENQLGLPEGWMDQRHPELAASVSVGVRATATLSTEPATPPYGLANNVAHALSLAPGEMWLPLHESVYPRMGRGSMNDGDEFVTLIKVTVEGLRRQLGSTSVTNLHSLRLVTALGDSMRGTFNHGDPLLVDTGVREVSHNGVYLLSGPQDLQVKRVQRRRGGDEWLLISDNPHYPPEVVAGPERDAYKVLGRIVFAWAGAVL